MVGERANFLKIQTNLPSLKEYNPIIITIGIDNHQIPFISLQFIIPIHRVLLQNDLARETHPSSTLNKDSNKATVNNTPNKLTLNPTKSLFKELKSLVSMNCIR